ncbi:tetratricopeptide repeat protein [Leptothermofonsia sp. ETS-13]|uniref:tetratricopeptide repeat-containing glycosyltransferase family protein n=1 Tax=Leptothermofonsia sp. ETS-13 TaxID=3035696 RepID=UPI003BA15657
MIADLLTTAMQHHQAGQLQEAEHLYRQVLQQQPNHPNALYLLGLIAHQMGNLDGAIALYQQAIASQPNFAEAHNNLGAAFQQQGNLAAAIAHYQATLRIKPDNPNANINLGVTLQQQGKLEAAIARYQKAIRLNPNLPEAYSNLAHALKERGELEQATSHYQTALQLTPNNPEAYRDLGDALQEQGRIDEAIALLDGAINQFPNHIKLQGSRIRAKLISGNLGEGFAEYDPWRLSLSSRTFSQPTWDGSNLNGQSILLYTETGAGIGDTIQFIRYAPLVAQRGGRVILECQPALVRLFQSIPGIETVIATDSSLPSFDVQASILSLPFIFGTTLETIPASIPYLSPPSISLFPLPESPHLKVGIVWGGDPNHRHDRDRSCPVQEFRRFLTTREIVFYSLQKGPHSTELAEIEELPIQDLGPQLNDFADTAAAITQLDLVISVDTSVAHLAGALGKPVWILLAFTPDWRWLMYREDSPWYPSARLFRQPHRNAWTVVCDQVAQELRRLSS